MTIDDDFKLSKVKNEVISTKIKLYQVLLDKYSLLKDLSRQEKAMLDNLRYDEDLTWYHLKNDEKKIEDFYKNNCSKELYKTMMNENLNRQLEYINKAKKNKLCADWISDEKIEEINKKMMI